ncbi:MAG: hypothetical protein ACLQVF_02835 [Isosphaeraceae bacterium]
MSYRPISSTQHIEERKSAMLIESEVQTRATRNQRRAIRETADAASRAVHDQEAAARQLAAQQARTAARTAEAAKQPKREQYLAANDDRTAWAQRFRSILTATQPVAELAPKTARPTSDPAVVNAIIEQYNPVGPAAIEATDVMIEQAGKPQTLASPGKKLGLPGQAMPGQAELQALALQSWREAERVTLAANAPDYEAVHNAMISQALYSPTLAPFAELSPSVVQGAYPPPMAQSLLAALAARNDSEDRNAGARLEDVDRNGLRHQLIPAASERLGTRAEWDDAQPTSWERPLAPILRDAQAREAVRPIQAGADRASTARSIIAAEALASWKDRTTIHDRTAAIDGRQPFDPREIIGQNRAQSGADVQPAILERVPAGGTRMPAVLAAGMERTSLPASEPLRGIFEPTRGATGGSSGQGIDTDRLARALEMFTQGLERFTGTGRLPALGAGRLQIAPVPPALPAKPAPFPGRTDGSVASF